MLKNGKCPQCGSTEIFSSPRGIGFRGGVQLTLGFGMQPNDNWTTYLCPACGLFENYVTDTQYLASVKSNPTIWTPL
jgi:predicted RNA-binding Zn-ribbon protein involved in translation (DUF1610 family)